MCDFNDLHFCQAGRDFEYYCASVRVLDDLHGHDLRRDDGDDRAGIEQPERLLERDRATADDHRTPAREVETGHVVALHGDQAPIVLRRAPARPTRIRSGRCGADRRLRNRVTVRIASG